MHWKYIVKSYKTKLISQARRQVAMLKICVALNKERGDCPLVLIIACHNHIVMSLFFKNLRRIKQRKGRLSISLNHSMSQSYRNVTFFQDFYCTL